MYEPRLKYGESPSLSLLENVWLVKTRHSPECPKMLGILENARLKQAFSSLPKTVGHSRECPIPQLACNRYTIQTGAD